MTSGNLKVLQLNVNRSLPTTEHVLQVAIELNISILAIQEPWTISTDNFRSVIHPSFKQVLPNCSTLRPRVLFYVLNTVETTLASNSPQDPDCVILDITEYSIQVINLYNAKHPESLDINITLQREGILPTPFESNTIFLGDFNTHHPWWDPLAAQSYNAQVLLDVIENNSLHLLNTPGEGTFYRPHMEAPSVLDLTFTTQGVVNKVEDWQILPDLGSDHFGVLFTILQSRTNTSPPKVTRFNTKKADWQKFTSNLQTYSKEVTFDFTKSKYTTQELDNLGELFTSAISQAAISSIPKNQQLVASKPWWNEDLKKLRRLMQKYYRKNKASGYTLFFEELKQAKNDYFNSIKLEKRKHWNQFLERETPSRFSKL